MIRTEDTFPERRFSIDGMKPSGLARVLHDAADWIDIAQIKVCDIEFCPDEEINRIGVTIYY
jgi:hypothetical protein